jgi:hypothetical protein
MQLQHTNRVYQDSFYPSMILLSWFTDIFFPSLILEYIFFTVLLGDTQSGRAYDFLVSRGKTFRENNFWLLNWGSHNTDCEKYVLLDCNACSKDRACRLLLLFSCFACSSNLKTEVIDASKTSDFLQLHSLSTHILLFISVSSLDGRLTCLLSVADTVHSNITNVPHATLHQLV